MKRPTKRKPGWQAKKRPPKTGRSVRAPRSPFQTPDGPRRDSNPLMAE